MFLSSRVGSFCWRLLLVYLLLVATAIPVPGIKGAWGAVFHKIATALFVPTTSVTIPALSALGCTTTVDDVSREDLSVRFDPKENPGRVLDTDMLIIRPNVALPSGLVTLAGRQSVSSWHKAYIPLAALLALVLATPVPWGRRAIALLWGIPLVVLFIWFGLTLTFIDGITAGDSISLFELSPIVKRCLSKTVWIICVAPVTSFLFPALIWLLVTFRHGDWGEVFGQADDNPESDA